MCNVHRVGMPDAVCLYKVTPFLGAPCIKRRLVKIYLHTLTVMLTNTKTVLVKSQQWNFRTSIHTSEICQISDYYFTHIIVLYYIIFIITQTPILTGCAKNPIKEHRILRKTLHSKITDKVYERN